MRSCSVHHLKTTPSLEKCVDIDFKIIEWNGIEWNNMEGALICSALLCAHRVREVVLAVLSLLLGPRMDHDEATGARDSKQLPYRCCSSI